MQKGGIQAVVFKSFVLTEPVKSSSVHSTSQGIKRLHVYALSVVISSVARGLPVFQRHPHIT